MNIASAAISDMGIPSNQVVADVMPNTAGGPELKAYEGDQSAPQALSFTLDMNNAASFTSSRRTRTCVRRLHLRRLTHSHTLEYSLARVRSLSLSLSLSHSRTLSRSLSLTLTLSLSLIHAHSLPLSHSLTHARVLSSLSVSHSLGYLPRTFTATHLFGHLMASIHHYEHQPRNWRIGSNVLFRQHSGVC